MSMLLLQFINGLFSSVFFFVGLETSPWDLSATKEIHVVANVSIAIQNWLRLNATPSGRDWYREKGAAILNSVAAFWASRVEFSPEKDAFVIKGEEIFSVAWIL